MRLGWLRGDLVEIEKKNDVAHLYNVVSGAMSDTV
jgi:hypothetical protein